MMQTAAVLDFARRPATRRPRYAIAEQMSRVNAAVRWLEAYGLHVEHTIASTLSLPIVVVTAHPRAYVLFSGRYERKGYRQDGARRYEIWEALDRMNQVRVRWEEVVACGA